MGKIKKVLSKSNIPKKGMLNDRLIVEWCENVHLHYRDLRLEFNEEDFEQLAITMFDAYLKYKNIKSKKPNSIKDLDKYHVLSQSKINGDGEFSDRLQIELQEENHIHIHYRNLRMEMSQNDFMNMSGNFDKAFKNMED